MKYFCEDRPSLHIIVAGSLLGISVRENESYPVGKVETIRMYPMTFSEFLLAKGKKGFAEGLGIDDYINSPTFTIVQVYDQGRLPLYHFDAYRIGDFEEMYEIGYEEYFFGNGVTIVEWASLIEEIMPENVIRITIEKDLEKGLDYRKIVVEE